jgi:hypothetical protein
MDWATGVRFPAVIRDFLYSTVSRPAVGPQWVVGALSLGVNRPGREADNSPSSGADVENGGAISPLLLMSSWCCA